MNEDNSNETKESGRKGGGKKRGSDEIIFVKNTIRKLLKDEEYKNPLEKDEFSTKKPKINKANLDDLRVGVDNELHCKYPDKYKKGESAISLSKLEEYVREVDTEDYSNSNVDDTNLKNMKEELEIIIDSKISDLSICKSKDSYLGNNKNKIIYKLIIKIEPKFAEYSIIATKLLFDIYENDIYYIENNYGAIVINCYNEKSCKKIFNLLNLKNNISSI